MGHGRDKRKKNKEKSENAKRAKAAEALSPKQLEGLNRTNQDTTEPPK